MNFTREQVSLLRRLLETTPNKTVNSGDRQTLENLADVLDAQLDFQEGADTRTPEELAQSMGEELPF
jgi:hypothetical protein